ncbi:MAG: hypothetical protein HC843_03175 [Sphingomonadales bacterium]|nr:hypothetical protein [Sphingomonadales bacterium]
MRNISALTDWIGNDRSIRFLEFSSVVALIAMAIFTATLLNNQNGDVEPLSPAMAASLLVANLLPATILLVLIGRRMALRRAELVNAGSKKRLHVRLVALFSLISATPTLLLVIFASLLFQSGVQFWFSGSRAECWKMQASWRRAINRKKCVMWAKKPPLWPMIYATS